MLLPSVKTGFDTSSVTLCSGSASQEQHSFSFSPSCMLCFPFSFQSQTEGAGKSLIVKCETIVRNCGSQSPSSFLFFRKQNLTHSYTAAATTRSRQPPRALVSQRQPSPAVLKHRVPGLGASPPTGDTFHEWPLDLIKEGPLFLPESVTMLYAQQTYRERPT